VIIFLLDSSTPKLEWLVENLRCAAGIVESRRHEQPNLATHHVVHPAGLETMGEH
jgi:hypothetical protein